MSVTPFSIPGKKDFLSYLLFIATFLIALYKIVFHLQLVLLPMVFIILGILSYLIHPRRALYLFFFCLPCINSLPDFAVGGYPYNYFALPLFYLSGLVTAAMIRRESLRIEGRWFGYYRLFLLLLWISVLFVFLKWFNPTVSMLALFKDTPVAPSGERLSFASIFPVLTLFLFSVSPFVVSLIKINRLKTEKIFQWLLAGYGLSLAMAMIQKFIAPDFLSRPIWASYNQFNGGFSDFNALGFFSGFIFLSSTIMICRRFLPFSPATPQKSYSLWFYAAFTLFSLAGIVISGSRTAFLFVLGAVIYFLSSRALKVRLKIIVTGILIVLMLAAGGMVKKRLFKTVDKFVEGLKSQGIVKALDRASNQRITMIRDSARIIGRYPLSGVGGGNFLFYMKKMHFGESFLHDLPLNQYLLVLDELGICGFLPFLLFLIAVTGACRGSPFAAVWYAILAALLVGNSLWLPEVAILFWIFIALITDGTHAPPVRRRARWIYGTILGLFLVGIIASFDSLHPLSWSRETAVRYDYGFWPPDPGPEGKLFCWTRGAAGLYIHDPLHRQIKLFAGAPIHRLKGKLQAVTVYWRGRKLHTFNFTVNRFETFTLDSAEPGFLELRINPTFNLKKMGLGPESRNLGIQFYRPR